MYCARWIGGGGGGVDLADILITVKTIEPCMDDDRIPAAIFMRKFFSHSLLFHISSNHLLILLLLPAKLHLPHHALGPINNNNNNNNNVAKREYVSRNSQLLLYGGEKFRKSQNWAHWEASKSVFVHGAVVPHLVPTTRSPSIYLEMWRSKYYGLIINLCIWFNVFHAPAPQKYGVCCGWLDGCRSVGWLVGSLPLSSKRLLLCPIYTCIYMFAIHLYSPHFI